MNRAERRRQKKTEGKEPVYQMTLSQIEGMKKELAERALEASFVLTLAIPVMVIHDKYPQIMKKAGREETFMNLCLDLFEMYHQGYVSLADLHKCLVEETGIKIKGIDIDKLCRRMGGTV